MTNPNGRPLSYYLPIFIVIVFALLIGSALIRNQRAALKIGSNSSNDSRMTTLTITVANGTADRIFQASFDLAYYVSQTRNGTNESSFSLLIVGPPDGEFNVPAQNMLSSGVTNFIWRGGYDRYNTFTFNYKATVVPLQVSTSYLFPWDTYSTTVIYFWGDTQIQPEIVLHATPPPGYVWNIDALGSADPNTVGSAIPPFGRVFFGPPPQNVHPSAFELTLMRDDSSVLVFATYALAGVSVTWLGGLLLYEGLNSPQERIAALLALAFAAVAYLWTFRQIGPPSLTIVEGLILAPVILLLYLEYYHPRPALQPT